MKKEIHKQFILVHSSTKSYIQSPEFTGQSAKQSITDYTQNHQRSDLEPLKKHTSFGTTHTKNVDLDNLKSTQHSLAYNTRNY